MRVRQLSIADFAAHCLEEIKAIQSGDTVLEILGNGGKVLAVLNPAPQQQYEGTLGEWVGSGSGLVSGDLNCLDEPTFVDAGEAAARDFWKPSTALEQAALQKVPIVQTLEDFNGDGIAEEWEGFDDALKEWRAEPISSEGTGHAA
jgi:hypothetical protein